jgi:hypothetical protein
MSFLRARSSRRLRGATGFLFAASFVSCGARTELASVQVKDAGTSGCRSGSSQPTVLATFGAGDLGPSPFAFAITPQDVFVEISAGGNPVAVDRVPLQGGTPQTVITGKHGCPSMSPFGGETPVATDGATFYMIGADLAGAACQGSTPTVTTYDVATGALGTVPPPNGTSNLNIIALRATAERGLYYLTGSEFDPSTSDLVHWDGTASTIVSQLPEWCWDLQIVGQTAFLMGAHELYEMPIGGGAATAIAPVTYGNGAALLAANSTSIFYTVDGATILGRNVATGMTITAAAPTKPFLESEVTWADDDYFYFGAGSPTHSGLMRVAVGGGAVETFWSSDRKIDAITTAGCNVYWLADTDFPNAQAPELLVGSK